jgi:hypothetical protein
VLEYRAYKPANDLDIQRGTMAEHFAVHPSELASGAGRVQGLTETCQELSSQLVDTLGDMIAPAGHPAVQSALSNAAGAAMRAMLDTGALLEHIGSGLAASGKAYSGVDAEHAQALSNIDVWK